MTKTTWIVVLLAACSLLTAAAEPEKNKELTLQDAIALALQKNVSLQVQVADTNTYQHQWQYQRGSYIPLLGLTVKKGNEDSPSSDIFSSNTGIDSTSELSGSLSVSQKIPTNGTLSLNIYSSRRTDSSIRTTIDPNLSSYVRFTFVQPLLKGFGTLAANKEIRVAANNMESSRHQLAQSIIDLVYNVENSYWNLVYSYQNLEATRTSLQQSRDLLKQNEIKVKVGTAAPIDVLEAKADVASYEANLIQAESDIRTSEEALKRLLNMSHDDLILIPSDHPQVELQQTDINTFLEEALNNRPDILRAKLALSTQGIEVKYQRNQNLPDLQLTISYGAYGQGGTQVDRYPPYTDPSDLLTRSLWDAFSDVIKRKYSGVSLSAELSIPVSFKQEKARMAIAKLNFEKTLLSLKDTENTVFSEVKQIIRDLETNNKLVEANRIALELYEQKLKAEEKKLSVGLSTNFQVLQYLSQYADAKNRALKAQIDYRLSVANMNKILGRTLKVYNIQLSDIETQK